MPARSIPAFVLASFAPLFAQLPPMTASPQMRYVDFHRDLVRPDVVVVVGTLGKGREGKREKLPESKLGGGAAVSVVSGTQYFKVPVQAPIQPRTTLAGKADKITIAFDVQVARLPDGKEKRQSMTGTAAPMDEGMLALFVLMPRDKGKGFDLLHVIAFDKEVDKGPDAEAVFGDTMSDYHAVNRRVLDFENALEAAEKAKDDESRKSTLEALKKLVDEPLQLRRSQNDSLVTMHVMPLEQRAKKKLADAAPKAEPAPEEKKGEKA